MSSPPAQSVSFQQTEASSSPPRGMSCAQICTHVRRGAHAGSAHGSAIPMFCGSATEETGVCERHPGVFGCEVSAARRSKCRVFLEMQPAWAQHSDGQLDEQNLPGAVFFLSSNWVVDLDVFSYSDATTRPCNDRCCCCRSPGYITVNANYLRVETKLSDAEDASLDWTLGWFSTHNFALYIYIL